MPTCPDCGGTPWEGHVCPTVCPRCCRFLTDGPAAHLRDGCSAEDAKSPVASERPDPHQLVGMAEASLILGVSDARVCQLIRSDPAFPVEIARLRATRVWWRSDMDHYAQHRVKGKRGRPKRTY